MHTYPDLSLIGRVRRGELNFDRLAAILSTRGYVTELEEEAGLGFGRVSMDKVRQEDFDALFKVLMPGKSHHVTLLCIATDKGAQPGAFTHALFSTNLVDYDVMMETLVQMNLAGAQG